MRQRGVESKAEEKVKVESHGKVRDTVLWGGTKSTVLLGVPQASLSSRSSRSRVRQETLECLEAWVEPEGQGILTF